MDDCDNLTEIENTTRLLYQIDRKSVCILKFLIEAYDGIAFIRTIDPFAAIIELTVAPGCEFVVKQLLQNLAYDLLIRRIDN